MRGVSSFVCRDKQTPPLSAITNLLHGRNVDDSRRIEGKGRLHQRYLKRHLVNLRLTLSVDFAK